MSTKLWTFSLSIGDAPSRAAAEKLLSSVASNILAGAPQGSYRFTVSPRLPVVGDLAVTVRRSTEGPFEIVAVPIALGGEEQGAHDTILWRDA